MSIVFSTTFPVRLYECDAYGHVNNTNHVRYMLETALQAGVAAGAGLSQEARVIALEIEYLRPLKYGDTVQVAARAAALERGQVRLGFDMCLLPGEDQVARGWLEYTVKPEAAEGVQQALTQYFFPLGMPNSFPAREPFPPAPPPPPGVFRMRRTVSWHELDLSHTVNPAEFLVYEEDCGMEVVAAHHWPVERMTQAGFAIILRKQQIMFGEPARLRDEIEIATWAYEVKRATAIRSYRMTRAADGAFLADIQVLGVWMDLETGRPRRVTAELLNDFAPNIVPFPQT